MHMIRRKGLVCYMLVLLATASLNAGAWCSSAFADWYAANIFPLWVNTYGRVTGLFSFSVGECMIAAGFFLTAAEVLLGLAWGICRIHRRTRRSGKRKRECSVDSGTVDGENGGFWLDRFMGGNLRFLAWGLLIVWLVMTLNYAILYHTFPLPEAEPGEDAEPYSVEELLLVRNLVVEKCNECAGAVARDERGRVQYPGSIREEMADQAIRAMQKLGQTYPRLDGYYPRPKPLVFSDVMCQQYMQGYYFPFSLEANYNDVMYVTNKPETLCHELAHLRGYIYEDEANFISYLACTQSEDLYFQYSGYLSVLRYLDDDVCQIARTAPDVFAGASERVPLIGILPQVEEDNTFVLPEDWARIQRKALLRTDTVEAVTDALLDANLKAHGVSDGMVSYSRVVRLLLQYYRQTGELSG